jgi:diguanylate cyclase (GGDEF)-like protein
MLVAPLKYNNTAVGVLKIASATPAAFGLRDKQLLEVMTDLIGAAIYKASDFNDLYERATHDPLTGVGNRALFYDRLRQGLQLAVRRKTGLGLIALDMDGLKPINDCFGHQAGDAAIREVARRLRKVCRQADTVARLGGDEFGVVLLDVGHRGNVEHQRERIEAEIHGQFRLGERELPLRASIGSAFYPEDGEDPVALVGKADEAMYSVKKQRKAAARN